MTLGKVIGGALVALALGLGAIPAEAAVKLTITGSVGAQSDELDGYTVNANYNPASYIYVQSWSFAKNAISVGGWLNFLPGFESVWFNQASNLPTAWGNYFAWTDKPWYSINATPVAGQASGLTFFDGSYTLSDGGTLVVENVKETLPSGPITTGIAVPEAATWVAMLAGFGMVGAAMRRRKLAVAA